LTSDKDFPLAVGPGNNTYSLGNTLHWALALYRGWNLYTTETDHWALDTTSTTSFQNLLLFECLIHREEHYQGFINFPYVRPFLEVSPRKKM
jgi:hypothetical protein